MSKLLYRIGRTAYDNPWRFIVSWVAILGIVLAILGVNGMHTSSEMRIAGTESQKVLDKLARELPAASGGQGSVVFTAPAGERLDTPERAQAIAGAVEKVYSLDLVLNPADYADQAAAASGDAQSAEAQQQPASESDSSAASAVAPPYGPLMKDGVPVPGVLIASDGSVALFQFQFTVQQTAVPDDVKDAVIADVKTAEAGTGITTLPGETLAPMPATGATEAIGIVVAAVVLFLTLGSVVSAGLPLLIAIVGVAVGVVGAYGFSKFVTMTSITPVLALMIGLAVGIDYSLFIINRQRRIILDQGLGAREAASRAVGTAGSAVFFAGLTVIIALSGMLVIGIEFLSTMALVAAATVFVSVLVALTLLPAMLGLVGERIVSKKLREKSKAHASEQHHKVSSKWVSGIVKGRFAVIVGIVVLLGLAAIPVSKMELGIPSGATANLDMTTRQSYDAIAKGFGEGYNGPLLLVAEPKEASGAVTMDTLGGLVGQIGQLEDVALVTPMGVNETGSMAILNLVPKSGPTDKSTQDLVKALRDPNSSFATQYGVTLGVTGFTAINIDMSAKLAEAFPIYVGVIVVLSIIILLLVFRSIIVPIKATVGFLLSVLATFGITTAVFQWGHLHSLFGFDTGGPLLSFMPILVTGILYGLAMDYQVFLVSSMRESYVHGHRGTGSVIDGYKQSSLVVVAAAVIMVSVFAGFIFGHDIMIKQIGFALAVGILIDSFIVRMTLVPAIMAIFGDKAWWLPKWLDRILPNLDVEGDKLLAELKAREHSAA